MKKIFFLASMAFMAITSVAYSAQPEPLTASTFTVAAPTIDGDDSDAAWASATAQPISVIFKGEEMGFGLIGSGDLDATFKVLEDGKKLYFVVNVDDDIVCQDPAQHWVGDKVELYFGLAGYVPADGASKPHSRQFAIKAQADPTVMGENGSNNYPPASNTLTTNGVSYGYSETATGYILEISIDRAIALEALPAGNVAFDLGIGDNDEGVGSKGVRYRKSWFNDGSVSELWANMTGTGVLKLNLPTETSALNTIKQSVSFSILNNILNVNADENAQIKILDISGKEVLNSNNSNKINISSLNNGVYFATIKNQNGAILGKIRFVK